MWVLVAQARASRAPPLHRELSHRFRKQEPIREVQGGFPKRIVERMAINDLPNDAPELLLSQLLDEYAPAIGAMCWL
jgi:hypothetical protein